MILQTWMLLATMYPTNTPAKTKNTNLLEAILEQPRKAMVDESRAQREENPVFAVAFSSQGIC